MNSHDFEINHTRPTSSGAGGILTLLCAIVTAMAGGDAVAQALPACAGNSSSDEMVRVGPICVDKFEASVWDQAGGKGNQYPKSSPRYPSWFPTNGNWTRPLYAASVQGAYPAAFLTWFQAQQACALSGKRLLTNAEWQMAAAGTPDPGLAGDGVVQCNTNTGGVLPAGQASTCFSRWGAHDMVGNLQEWVADWIQGPGINPSTVSNLFAPALYLLSTKEYGTDAINGINEAFHLDAPQSAEPIQSAPDAMPAGIARGGSWTGRTGAGAFALEATHTPSSRDNATGFRCAR
ncbi:formylglycine-generating enzyme family protein [Piscinibacter defluvii]|uniref:formylglycine-generating enzyme family protein n=1 Tax=Piscinibacter defluvii TaxID=1796922 RepID=UPI000FDEC099|nr:SUMF1/EgtB/PvdO family nonheme iron enzyme [Piscinibacter defluvii]